MNRLLQLATTKTPFSDFAAKLTERWRFLTTPTNPDLPEGGSPESTLEDIFRELVSLPTITGNTEANHDALDYIDQFLHTRGMQVTRLSNQGIESLVATTKPTKTPTVMLAAHIDVVPAPESHFELRIEDGNYMGRGVFDMKFAAAVYLQVIDDIKEDLDSYDLGIMITTDEEVGGFDGTGWLVDQGYLPKVVVLPDGGDNWDVETNAKGLCQYTITTSGKNAHASRPWEGESASEKLITLLHDIKAIIPESTKEGSTFNIGTLTGGKALNQVPAHASAGLDMRFATAEEQSRVITALHAICKKHQANIASEIIARPMVNDPTNPYLTAFMHSIEKTIGRKAGTTSSLAASDARFFSDKGIPCAIVRPEGGNHHGPGEWISKQGVHQLHGVILDYLRTVARVTQEARLISKPTHKLLQYKKDTLD